MIRTYRIDHIAQVVDNHDAQVEVMTDVFGFTATHSWHGNGFRGTRLAVPGNRGHSWVVMHAEDGGTGIHHVAIEVPDLAAAQAELGRRGVGVEVLEEGRWIAASLSPPAHQPGLPVWIRGPQAPGLPGESPLRTETPHPEGTVGITAINHVCQAFADRDELSSWLTDLAGFVEVWRTPDGTYPDMADLVLSIPGSEIYWEIMSPVGDGSFVERFLGRQGPVGHHVTFEVADWEHALTVCEQREVPIFGVEEGFVDDARWKHLFIRPQYTAGTLVQLFWESRPGVWVRSKHVAPVEKG